MKQTNFQGNGKHSCMPRKGKTFLTRRRQQWSLPELHFRAPSKETASNRQSWQGEGGPGMKGRAGIMVNLRVKHATRGWGQAAQHHKEEKKGLPEQHHFFILNGNRLQQCEPMRISMRRVWLTRLHPQQHRVTVLVTAVVSQFSQQFMCSAECHCLSWEMILPVVLIF